MRFLLVTACTALAAVVLATGDTPPVPDGKDKPVTGEVQVTEVIKTGKTLGPLSPDEVGYAAVTVPEPVWASILAACAVIILRRGRQ